MSLAIAGTIADGEVLVRGVDNVDTSFPGFQDLMTSLGARITVEHGEVQ
jgi:5-enolpyruvylshikimate-3-phosphate synthase